MPEYRCGWDLVHSCNYRCRYCFFISSWETDAEATNARHRGLDASCWFGFWDRLHERYGPFRIEVAGGEPSQHPDFFPLVAGISRGHTFRIVTNLSFDPGTAIERFDPGRVSFSASFHPEFAALPEFLSKLSVLKDAGFPVVASIVAHPAFFSELGGWRESFLEAGVRCFLNPFQGVYGGREFPAGYSEEERGFVEGGTFPEALEFRFRKRSPKGLPCSAGRVYFRIWPDGRVYRCCGATEAGEAPIGSVRDPEFALFSEPRPCPAERCFAPNEIIYLETPFP